VCVPQGEGGYDTEIRTVEKGQTSTDSVTEGGKGMNMPSKICRRRIPSLHLGQTHRNHRAENTICPLFLLAQVRVLVPEPATSETGQPALLMLVRYGMVFVGKKEKGGKKEKEEKKTSLLEIPDNGSFVIRLETNKKSRRVRRCVL
jgi:hypothetical protein